MPPGRGRGGGGRSRSTPYRRSGRPTTRASSVAAGSSQGGFDGNPGSSQDPSLVPQGTTAASLEELRNLMLIISSQLSSHHGPLPASTASVSPAPQNSPSLLGQSSSLLGDQRLVQQQQSYSLATAVSTASQPQTTAFLPPPTAVSTGLGASSLLPPAAPRLLPGIGTTGSGAGVLGELPPPQGLASVPLCSASPLLAHTAVPTQLHGPSQAPVVPTRQASGGLVLSPDCQPIPAKLVEKARSGEFMEMREFLLDNVKLLDKLESTGFHQGTSRPRMREVSSPLAWIHCFLAYTAIRCQDPFARDMLSYARLVLGEAMCHGGTGWLEYDRAARQQRAIDPLRPWNVIDPGLHSAFILSRSSASAVKRCSSCQGVDHSASQCALASIEPASQQSWTEPRRRSFVCISWNRGACSFPGTCSYRHVCSLCFGSHRARECSTSKSAPTPSQSRRNQQTPPKQ